MAKYYDDLQKMMLIKASSLEQIKYRILDIGQIYDILMVNYLKDNISRWLNQFTFLCNII